MDIYGYHNKLEFIIDNQELNDSIINDFNKETNTDTMLWFYSMYLLGNDSLFLNHYNGQINKQGEHYKFISGLAEIINGNNDSALICFKESEKNVWANIEIYHLMVLNENDDLMLVNYLEKMVRNFQNYSTPKLLLADQMFRMNRLEEAIKLLGKIEHICKSAFYYEILGNINYKNANYILSEENYKKSISLSENSNSYNGLGNIYFYINNNPSKGKEYYLKSLEINQTTEVLRHLGYVETALENFDKAENYFNEIITLEPNNEDYYYDRLWFYILVNDLKSSENQHSEIGVKFNKKYNYYKYDIVINMILKNNLIEAKKSYNIINQYFKTESIKLESELSIWEIDVKMLK